MIWKLSLHRGEGRVFRGVAGAQTAVEGLVYVGRNKEPLRDVSRHEAVHGVAEKAAE